MIWTADPVCGQSTVAPTVTPLRSLTGQLHAPARITTDAAGRLYVTDSASGRVLVRDQYGRLERILTGLERPLGIAVDAAGFVYVGEEGRGRVTVFDQSWTAVRRLGAGDGEFSLPNHIASDPNGPVYVADSGANVIKKYSPSGQLLLIIGAPGIFDGQFRFPTGLCLTANGELIVADQDNVRLQVFRPDGAFVRKIRLTSGMLGGGGGRIQGVTVDALGRIYVADAFQDIVRVLGADGTRLSSIGTFGSGPGQLLNPSGLAIDRHNRLFVASAGGARIDLYGLDAYSDPHLLAAAFSLRPAVLTRAAREGNSSPTVTGLIRVDGYDPTRILRATVRINGVAILPAHGVSVADFDDDGNLELRALVDRAALVGTLADGTATVTVSGFLDDGMEFEGSTTVDVHTPGGAQKSDSRPRTFGGTR